MGAKPYLRGHISIGLFVVSWFAARGLFSPGFGVHLHGNSRAIEGSVRLWRSRYGGAFARKYIPAKSIG